MSESPRCPSAETLALLPDGRASRDLRLSLMAHLDGCTYCRRILAYAGRYEALRRRLRDGSSELPEGSALPDDGGMRRTRW
jgi:hypothetical protein